jgi:hypothetical protein
MYINNISPVHTLLGSPGKPQGAPWCVFPAGRASRPPGQTLPWDFPDVSRGDTCGQEIDPFGGKFAISPDRCRATFQRWQQRRMTLNWASEIMSRRPISLQCPAISVAPAPGARARAFDKQPCPVGHGGPHTRRRGSRGISGSHRYIGSDESRLQLPGAPIASGLRRAGNLFFRN